MKAVKLLMITAVLVLSSNANSSQKIPGQYIVEMNSDSVGALSAMQAYGTVDPMGVSFGEYAVLKNVDSSKLEELKNHPMVKSIEPDYWVELSATLEQDFYSTEPDFEAPTDSRFADQWGLRNNGKFGSTNWSSGGLEGFDINILEAWKKEKGLNDIIVAVIDTGVNTRHPDFERMIHGNIWTNWPELGGLDGVDDDRNGYIDDFNGWDFVRNDNRADDGNGHGTHCAGVIGARHNGEGIAGIMSETSIMALKFLDSWGRGSFSDAVKAIDYAIKNNADVISASWGGSRAPNALKKAIERANEEGIVFVAAAGNSSNDAEKRPLYPAAFDLPNVISVAATNHEGKLASFSNYGANVHVAAPGRDILSTYKDGYKLLSGTSMATPHVAGMVGLLLSSNVSYRYSLSPEEIRERLIETSVPYDDIARSTLSGGQVEANRLLLDKRD
jgi:subtilisin family serine protease